MSGREREITGVQPWLHELSVCVHGNATALSAADGQMRGMGAEGFFVDDRRVLSVLMVSVGSEPPAHVASASVGSRAQFLASLRALGDGGPDPTVELHRERRVVDSGLVERIVVVSRAALPVRARLLVEVAGDGADIDTVKLGLGDALPLPATAHEHGVSWSDERHETTLSCQPMPDEVQPASEEGRAGLAFDLDVPPGDRAEVSISVTVRRTAPSLLDADAAAGLVDWAAVRVRGDDPRLEPTVRTSLEDLRELLLTDPLAPDDMFTAAGTPWYLTLFGRDALWSARMMLPFGTELAGGTLRALARRQGRVHDEPSGEAPGKIPHELRRSAYGDPNLGMFLPPVYYGTIDATPLWVTLLHDAWQWGLPEDQVVALLPALRDAARWLTEDAAPGEAGLLRYVDRTGTGLANQGWKDSDDSVRWRDGRIADAPIALVEAQAYAVEAGEKAALLLRAFGQPGADDLVQWSAALRDRLAERFWVDDPSGEPYLGIAVDGTGGTVDGVASNMGHVLGTGALDPAGAARVAQRLLSPTLLGRYGIATLASDNGGYNPIGYHTGSIWTHDTAICAWGLQREGRSADAVTVARTLLSSAAAFHYRWPELYAGNGVLGLPAPYPASCRPQAWSAASAAVLLWVALGFEPDAPSGRLVLRPARPAAYGAFEVSGLRFGGQPFAVAVAADGTVTLPGGVPGFDVQVR
ncbi:MAG TPA: glycogen debranching N-terminal domain-containing protein [Dermatophilaceae bacterium]|nr:glycogen debranching N-terminal domain-containing protein [Dermatophilaceae bacterium]